VFRYRRTNCDAYNPGRELPEFNGKGPSEWAKRADQIIDTDEFIQYQGDVDAAVRDYDICRIEYFKAVKLLKEIKDASRDVRTFMKTLK
jgi:hypothetical protein